MQAIQQPGAQSTGDGVSQRGDVFISIASVLTSWQIAPILKIYLRNVIISYAYETRVINVELQYSEKRIRANGMESMRSGY